MSIQSIVLRRLNKILVPTSSDQSNAALVATFNLNLQSLGYTLSPKAIKSLSKLNETTASRVFDEVISLLKEIKGVHNYNPMYPNFPKQVIEASDAELYINAIIHYFSFVLVDITGDPDSIWLPKYVKDHREPLAEKIELRVLSIATDKDVKKFASSLAASNTSLSVSDKEDLRVLFNSGFLDFPESVPNKENLAFLGALFYGRNIDLTPYFKTATDVLRLATALSEGDVSLKDNTAFCSFKRSKRRFLLGLLEPIPNKLEDMSRWSERWKRLAHALHPGDFAIRFPTTFVALNAIRNNDTVTTVRSQIEDALRNKESLKAVSFLVQRPGDFARRLDHVLRITNSHSRILSSFENVVSEISTPVLLQALEHFKYRDGMRVAFPKGNVAKVTAIESVLPKLRESTIKNVIAVIEKSLIERFSSLPKLGKVYIDPDLKDYLVPFSQRSASKTLRTLVRGSKLKFDNDKDTIRFFIWWHDQKDGSRVDLDLSAVGFDNDWNHKGHIAFYNLRDNYAVHSGDITSAPNGASEFIDVDIPKALLNGMRYIVMTVHGFTEQNFIDLPECFAGFMLREKAQSEEVYDPRTVMDRSDLTAGCRDSVPLIIDLVDRKVIWCDAAMAGSVGHTVASSRGSIQLLGKAFANIKKPNLFDLFSLHAKARGKIVTDQGNADVVFSVKDAFELEKISSEFMANAETLTPA